MDKFILFGEIGFEGDWLGFPVGFFPACFADGGADDSDADDDDDAGDDNDDAGDDDTGKDKDQKSKDQKFKRTSSKDKDKDTDSGDDDDSGSKKFDVEYVKSLRAEAAKYRKEKKEESEKVKALKQAIQKALGLEDDDQDPVKLEKQLNALKAELREEKLRNKFTHAAIKAEADPELTYAYLKYKGELDDLDVEDGSFGKMLEAIIQSAIDSNPRLKSEKEPPKKTGDDTGADKDKRGGVNFNDLIRKAAGRG